jgi:hypothetical protein
MPRNALATVAIRFALGTFSCGSSAAPTEPRCSATRPEVSSTARATAITSGAYGSRSRRHGQRAAVPQAPAPTRRIASGAAETDRLSNQEIAHHLEVQC